MSKDLIQALVTIAVLPMPEQDNMVSANMRKIAEDALSRHRSSVESVELPEPEARVELWPDDSVRLAIVPNGPISENEVYYTATTVRILIAAAVEREREECAVMFDRRGWVSADQIAAAIRSRGEMK